MSQWEPNKLDDIFKQAIACSLDGRELEVECIDANKANSLRYALFWRKKKIPTLPNFTIRLKGASVFVGLKGEKEEGIIGVRAVEVGR